MTRQAQASIYPLTHSFVKPSELDRPPMRVVCFQPSLLDGQGHLGDSASEFRTNNGASAEEGSIAFMTAGRVGLGYLRPHVEGRNADLILAKGLAVWSNRICDARERPLFVLVGTGVY